MAILSQWDAPDITRLALGVIISTIIILLNGLLLCLFARESVLRKPRNYYIASLASADITLGLVVPPLTLLEHYGLPTNLTFCIFTQCLVGCFRNLSTLFLICIFIDRYYVLKHPEWVLRMSLAITVISCTWLVALLVGLLPVMGWNNPPLPGSPCSYRPLIPLEYNVYLQFFGFTVPLLLLVIVVEFKVLWLFRTVRKRMLLNNSRTDDQSKKQTLADMTRKGKMFQYLTIMFAAVAISLLPTSINQVVRLFSPDAPPVPHGVFIFFHLLSHCNAIVNPVAYGFRQPDFRRALRQAVMSSPFHGIARRFRSVTCCSTCCCRGEVSGPSEVLAQSSFGHGTEFSGYNPSAWETVPPVSTNPPSPVVGILKVKIHETHFTDNDHYNLPGSDSDSTDTEKPGGNALCNALGSTSTDIAASLSRSSDQASAIRGVSFSVENENKNRFLSA